MGIEFYVKIFLIIVFILLMIDIIVSANKVKHFEEELDNRETAKMLFVFMVLMLILLFGSVWLFGRWFWKSIGVSFFM